MRDLLISFLIVLFLMVGWLFFDDYSHQSTLSLSNTLENDIIPSVEKEDWEKATAMYDEFENRWGSFERTSLFFLENDQISEIDLCIARAEKYIEAKDVSNSAGELCSIAKQLELLDKREKITLSNIL